MLAVARQSVRTDLHGQVREAAACGLEDGMVATTYRVSMDAIPLQIQRDVWLAAPSSIMLDCRLPGDRSVLLGRTCREELNDWRTIGAAAFDRR